MDITLTINGRTHAVAIDLRTTLLDLLRDRTSLTDTQKSLRPGPMRRLHRADGRKPSARLLHNGRRRVKHRDHHH